MSTDAFMPLPLLLACTSFMLVSSVTPGPNNTMLLASGLHFGVRRSLRHLMGIQCGFALLVALAATGLLGLLQALPGLQRGLQLASVAYLLWLAWGLAMAPVATESAPSVASNRAPMGFWAAVAFQWVNPKAWVMAITALSVYLPPAASAWQLLGFCALFFVMGLPSSTLWLVCGQWLRRWLQSPQRQRRFNQSMALALVASVLPMLL